MAHDDRVALPGEVFGRKIAAQDLGGEHAWHVRERTPSLAAQRENIEAPGEQVAVAACGQQLGMTVAGEIGHAPCKPARTVARTTPMMKVLKNAARTRQRTKTCASSACQHPRAGVDALAVERSRGTDEPDGIAQSFRGWSLG